MDSFDFYKHIDSASEISEIKDLFDKNGIEYQVSSGENLFDKTLVGEAFHAKYTLKINAQDFEKADDLIRDAKENEIDISEYSHLQEMTNDELVNIVVTSYEWSIESEIAAKKILQSRNYPLTDTQIDDLKDEHISLKFKAKNVHPILHVLSILSIFAGVFNILFLAIGIGMGFNFAFNKAVDPKGNKYYLYDERSRLIGKCVFYLSSVLIIGGVLWMWNSIFKRLG